MAHDPTQAATDRDRMAVVQALSAARRREELEASDQLERTELALAATTIGDLEPLLDGLTEVPELPVGVSRRGLLVALGGVAAVAVGGGVALLGQSGDDPAPRAVSRETPTPSPSPTPSPTPSPDPTPPPVPSLFTVAGLELLLKDYRAKFGTWWTYELTVIDEDQARSDVPIGPLRKRRLQWWSWDADDRWNTIFDPSPVGDPNAQAVDLRKVDLKAALANRPRARRSLGVENPEPPGLEITWHREYGAVVQYYVSNSFHEGGVMFTDLSGKILARHPFQRS